MKYLLLIFILISCQSPEQIQDAIDTPDSPLEQPIDAPPEIPEDAPISVTSNYDLFELETIDNFFAECVDDGDSVYFERLRFSYIGELLQVVYFKTIYQDDSCATYYNDQYPTSESAAIYVNTDNEIDSYNYIDFQGDVEALDNYLYFSNYGETVELWGVSYEK